jgi:hypothetical protein
LSTRSLRQNEEQKDESKALYTSPRMSSAHCAHVNGAGSASLFTPPTIHRSGWRNMGWLADDICLLEGTGLAVVGGLFCAGGGWATIGTFTGPTCLLRRAAWWILRYERPPRTRHQY